MRTFCIFLVCAISALATIHAETRYIEVDGTAHTEVAPDEIHYIVQLREYFTEEFDGKKPQDFRTHVSIQEIDNRFRQQLACIGITEKNIRLHDIGDYGWRREGEQFYVSKCYDITLADFSAIDKINEAVDRRAVEYMRVGDLISHNIDKHRRQCRIDALKAARDKAEYMARALGSQVGDVISIEEPSNIGLMETAASPVTANVASNSSGGYDNFRTIALRATVRVKFALN